MGARSNVKRDRFIEAAVASAKALDREVLDPGVLFGRASNDDLEHYSPAMLAEVAAHAQAEIAAWNGSDPRVSVTTIEAATATDTTVTVLSVTDRNMPFLYDSVMGEVTSTHRDIHLAIHPILVVEEGKAPVLFSPEIDSDPARRASHIEIHLSELSATEAANLSDRILHVLTQVHLAVADWQPMLATLEGAVGEMERYGPARRKGDKDEALAFVAWLRDSNFTFLGMREYTYSGKGRERRAGARHRHRARHPLRSRRARSAPGQGRGHDDA